LLIPQAYLRDVLAKIVARHPMERCRSPTCRQPTRLRPENTAYDTLLAELNKLKSSDAAANWAHRSLPAKNTVTAWPISSASATPA